MTNENRYVALIARIFEDRYKSGAHVVPFIRSDIKSTAKALDIVLPDNLGDVIHSFRFRTKWPAAVTKTAPAGKEWVIALAGRSKYEFRLSSTSRITPNTSLAPINVPDAT